MHYLILFRSLTLCQRAANLLRRAGIYASVTKAPQSAVPEGCAYAVKLGAQKLTGALELLRRENLVYRRILLLSPQGEVSEAVL